MTTVKARQSVLLMLGVLLAHLFLMATPVHARIMSGPPSLAGMTESSQAGSPSSSLADTPTLSLDCAIRAVPAPCSSQAAFLTESIRTQGRDAADGAGRSSLSARLPVPRALTRAFLQSFLT